MEWKLAGKIEVLGENLLHFHFVHLKSHMTIIEPGFGISSAALQCY
jgi:hypothetical protein